MFDESDNFNKLQKIVKYIDDVNSNYFMFLQKSKQRTLVHSRFDMPIKL